MEIVDKTTNGFISFEKLKVGDVFTYRGSVFIKINDGYICDINAFNLSSNIRSLFNLDDPVKKTKAILTIMDLKE